MLLSYAFAIFSLVAALADVKFVTEFHSPGYRGRPVTSTITTYVSGRRIRLEYRNASGSMDGSVQYGPLIASVMLCDTGKSFEINTEDGEYRVGELPRYPSLEEVRAKAEEAKARAAAAPRPAPQAATVNVERTTVRTGETRQMFGHTARHVITTTRYIPGEGAQHPASEEVRDGWYIAFDVRTDCVPDYLYQPRGAGLALLRTRIAGEPEPPLDRYKLHQVGEPETGFALQEKFTTRYAGTPQNDTVTEHVITEFSEQPLPDSLFSPPAGFKQVSRIRTAPPLPLKYRLAAWWQRVSNWFH